MIIEVAKKYRSACVLIVHCLHLFIKLFAGPVIFPTGVQACLDVRLVANDDDS